MADIQTQLPIKITDGTNTAAISGTSALKVDSSAVTQPVSGTVTLSSQTVTLSSQTVTLAAGSAAIGTVVTNADTSTAAGAAPSKALLNAGIFNTTQPTLTTGQTVATQMDTNGNVKVVLQGSSTVTSVPSGTQTVQAASGFNVTLSSQTVTLAAGSAAIGTVATNADTSTAAGAAPSKALLNAGIFNTTQPTLTTGQTVATQMDTNGNIKVALQGSATVTLATGTNTVGTVTTIPSGTQTVQAASAFNVTLSSQTVTLSSNTVTLAAGTASIGSVTVVPETSQVVTSYSTSVGLAAASTATLTYTVTAAKTLYWKGVMAASSGGPCKVTVQNGGTTFAVGFYSTTAPFLNIVFPQPLIVAATTVIQILIQNNAGSAQDVYGTFFGAEH